jgi:hypothetical protein
MLNKGSPSDALAEEVQEDPPKKRTRSSVSL